MTVFLQRRTYVHLESGYCKRKCATAAPIELLYRIFACCSLYVSYVSKNVLSLLLKLTWNLLISLKQVISVLQLKCVSVLFLKFQLLEAIKGNQYKLDFLGVFMTVLASKSKVGFSCLLLRILLSDIWLSWEHCQLSCFLILYIHTYIT